MNVQMTHEKSVRKYVIAIALFIVVVALCLAVFFVGLFDDVERTVERNIWKTIALQSRHIDFVFSVRFQHLQSAADFLGKQDDIHGETALQYIQSLSENSTMQHVAICDADGNAVVDNGDTLEGLDLEYIHLALKGERSVSDLSESVVDGEKRFFLSVPVRRDGEIVGALIGSFDIDELGNLLFEDSYEGQSVLFITDLSGRIVYSDTPENIFDLTVSKSLYNQFRRAEFLDGRTADELVRSFERRETGMTLYHQFEGNTLFLLYTPVADSNLLLMHAIPRKAAYGDFDTIERSVILVGVALLICVVLLVIFLILSSTHSQRSLVHFAQTDPLTGLCNKQHTQEAIDLWLRDEACTGIQAMLFLDIDYFKQINDHYGHSIGDEALRFVGQALQQEFRSSDIIGRVGGDEFVVFMRNVPVKHAVRHHAASLRARVKSAEISGLDKGMLHCSIGIAYAPEHGSTYHELTVCADKALYQTKEHGRDGFTEYFDPLRQKKPSVEEQSGERP